MINCDYNFVMCNSFFLINIIGNSFWIYLNIFYWNKKKKIIIKEIGVFFYKFLFFIYFINLIKYFINI